MGGACNCYETQNISRWSLWDERGLWKWPIVVQRFLIACLGRGTARSWSGDRRRLDSWGRRGDKGSPPHPLQSLATKVPDGREQWSTTDVSEASENIGLAWCECWGENCFSIDFVIIFFKRKLVCCMTDVTVRTYLTATDLFGDPVGTGNISKKEKKTWRVWPSLWSER